MTRISATGAVSGRATKGQSLVNGLACVLLSAYVLPLYATSPSSYECLIEPAETVELGTAVGGVLSHVYVRRGERIKHGQVLATLDSRAEQASADLARYKSQLAGPTELAEAKIEFSKRKFERRKDMAAEKLLAQQDSDDAESDLRQAQADLKVAQENRKVAQLEYEQQQAQLALRTIRSPLDGVVVDQMIWPGETVEPGATKHAILKLARLDPLHVREVMPMQAFGKFTAGMKATVVPEIQPGKNYTASISSIDPTIDAASGTFVVFLDLPNPRFDMPSGVKCQATFGARSPRQQARP